MKDKVFADSNILLYLLSDDERKKKIAKHILQASPSISTQVVIEKAFELKATYKFHWYDSMILSSAILDSCTILYSEDMHHDQLIDASLRIINPFL